MKKAVSLFLCLLLLLSFSGCKIDSVPNPNSGKLSIITTSFPPYDFARAIGGEFTSVTMLLPPGQESHTFEPTPQDMIALSGADLIIAGGGTSDEWMKKLISSSELDKEKVLFMMDCVETKEAETDSHAHGHSYFYEYDEHVWTSPKNAQKICKAILERLITIDKENAAFYEENAAAYSKQLKQLDEEFRSFFKMSSLDTLIFADRFPFRYFADEYGLAYFAAFPGCAGETEPDAATMKMLIDKVNVENIPAVFYTELSNQKIADTILESTTAKKLLLHSCHTVTKDEFERGETYISLMKQNLANLKEALIP